jgi:23S rRNA (uracil1939-C5)-methyltransferase
LTRSPAGEVWLAALRREFLVAESDAVRAGPELLQRFDLGRQVYLLAAPGSFTQVNWDVNRLLIERVLEGAHARGARSFLDAYAGAGNFALPLLAAGLSGVAVEANAAAILAARAAAHRQALPSAGFIEEDVARWARREAGQRFDLVLLDPPRSGVKQGLQHLAAMATSWLAMCSCNPVTLARDLRALIDLGFELDVVEAFDMFPETHHVETLVWLRAPRASARAADL